MKHYLKYAAIAVALFIWFTIVGPRMMSGPTETMVLWLLGTIFVLVPVVYWLVRGDLARIVSRVRDGE